jgi:hypothetical protein
MFEDFGLPDVVLFLSLGWQFQTFRRIIALSFSREDFARGHGVTSQMTRPLNTNALRTQNLVVFAGYGNKFRVT